MELNSQNNNDNNKGLFVILIALVIWLSFFICKLKNFL